MIGRLVYWMLRSQMGKEFLVQANKLGIRKHLLDGHAHRKIIHSSKPGDIILIRAAFEATSELQASDYTHLAIRTNTTYLLYLTEKLPIDSIVHSTGEEGVHKDDILDLFVGIDKACVLKLPWPEAERQKVAARAEYYAEKGVPYDWKFEIKKEEAKDDGERKGVFSSTKKEQYCSESGLHCINDVRPNYLELWDRLGELTITPDDFRRSVDKGKFELACEIKA